MAAEKRILFHTGSAWNCLCQSWWYGVTVGLCLYNCCCWLYHRHTPLCLVQKQSNQGKEFQWVTKTTPPQTTIKPHKTPNPTHKTKQHTLTDWKAGWLLASFSKALGQLSFCCCCWSFSPLKEGAGACWFLQSLTGCRHSALGTSLESDQHTCCQHFAGHGKRGEYSGYSD